MKSIWMKSARSLPPNFVGMEGRADGRVDRTVTHMKDEAANFPDLPIAQLRKKNLALNFALAIASVLSKKLNQPLIWLMLMIMVTVKPAAWRLAFSVWRLVQQLVSVLIVKRWMKSKKNSSWVNILIFHRKPNNGRVHCRTLPFLFIRR